MIPNLATLMLFEEICQNMMLMLEIFFFLNFVLEFQEIL